ncbi:hypothetical protein F5Y04DRAFT_288544 [Hypomontagnella monticulosa]|nr:hypothetical protein F5Y04DRAFT_288544 [Hypomontagnella monticulosa]
MRLPSLFAVASSIMLLAPATARELRRQDDTQDLAIVNFKDSDKINGTLKLHVSQTLNYYKKEIGVDMPQLLKHPELFTKLPKGEYTFPKDSGVEGTLTWDLPEGLDRKSESLVGHEHMTCKECLTICEAAMVIPFGFVICGMYFLPFFIYSDPPSSLDYRAQTNPIF